MQLRGNVLSQVSEAEAEAEAVRATAEQERQAQLARLHGLLADKAALQADLHRHEQVTQQLQVLP